MIFNSDEIESERKKVGGSAGQNVIDFQLSLSETLYELIQTATLESAAVWMSSYKVSQMYLTAAD